jgi:hypothetical protein
MSSRKFERFEWRVCIGDVHFLGTGDNKFYKERRIRRIASSGMLRCVVLVRTDVSEERSTSIIKVARIGELETVLAVTSSGGC